MDRRALAAGVAVALVAVAVLAYTIVSGMLPHPIRRVVCRVVARVPAATKASVGDAYVEVVKGVKMVRECELILSIPRRFCYGTSEGTKCSTLYRVKVLRKWRNETIRKYPVPTIKVTVNLTKFTKDFIKENAEPTPITKQNKLKIVIGTRFFDPTKDYWTGPVIPKNKIVFNGTKNVVRQVLGKVIVFEVPVMKSRISRTGYLVPLERYPTYLKHVVAPVLEYLVSKGVIGRNTEPKKVLALAIQDIIEESKYNYERHSRSDIDFLLMGGECSNWAGYAYFLASLLKLHALYVGASTSQGAHATAFLCEPWWRNNYGIKLYLRNGSTLTCYIWVDTGWAEQDWKNYEVYPLTNTWIDAATGKTLPVIKVIKTSG